jgi:hypothetical protein
MKINLTSVYVADQEKAQQRTRTARSRNWRSTTTQRPNPASRPCSSKVSPRPCSTAASASRLRAYESERRRVHHAERHLGNLIQIM